ncbi:hypothetical protein IP84_13975 [beta proteobacterium AAP99]|nr:hypothetical protein IP84_13975 [beta proteobacterium AAP99]
MAAGVIIVYIFGLIVAAVLGRSKQLPRIDPPPTSANSQEDCEKAIAELNKMRAQECERQTIATDAREKARIAGDEAAIALAASFTAALAAAAAVGIPVIGPALSAALGLVASSAAVWAAYKVGQATAALETSRGAQDNLAAARAERRRASTNVTTVCPMERALAANQLPPCP